MKNGNHRLSRRDFLQSGALAAMAVGAVPIARQQTEKKGEELDPAKIRNFSKDMKYRQVGNTGIYLSALCIGGGDLTNPAVVNRAIETGVNVFHTGLDYRNANSMAVLADAIKTKRDKIYIALKDTFPKESPNDIDPVLKMLGTGHVDFIFYARHKADEIISPEIQDQFEGFKAKGKVSYLGLSTHGEVKSCIAAAVDCGMYSVIHAALPPSGLELASEELRKAGEKGISVIPFKSVRDIEDSGLQIAQFKKLLSNPLITSVNRGLPSLEMLETYTKAIKESLTASEDIQLYRHARMNRSDSCAMCGMCDRACPRKIEISTLLRAKTYYHDQLGDRDKALATYMELSPPARHEGNCLECRRCETACPNGIRITRKMNEADLLFRRLLG
jgi:predicted aldo/keto reductase-like oxidoreductase